MELFKGRLGGYVMKLFYTPLHSFVKYIQIQITKGLKPESQNIGKKFEVFDNAKYTVFKEIYLLTPSKTRKEGNAIFQVIFHSPKEKMDDIIKRTTYTIPFFIGLPGFCNKQFMVNTVNHTFAGNYEWETVELAQKYANSYAVAFMSRRSKPFPLQYRIINKTNNTIVEEREV